MQENIWEILKMVFYMGKNVLQPSLWSVDSDSVKHDGHEEEVVDEDQANKGSGQFHFKQPSYSEHDLTLNMI